MDFKRLDLVLDIVARKSPCNKNSIGSGYKEELDLLEKISYITLDEVSGGTECTISAEGMKFYVRGGFEKQLSNRSLELEALRWDMKINKWQHRLRWLPFILSAIALVISAIALFEAQCVVADSSHSGRKVLR